jgi:hypothetical protein
MLSSSLALPGPIRAPDSKTMLTLSRAIAGTVPRSGLQIPPDFPETLSDIIRLVQRPGSPDEDRCRGPPVAAAPADKGRVRAVAKPYVTVYGYARVSTDGQSVDRHIGSRKRFAGAMRARQSLQSRTATMLAQARFHVLPPDLDFGSETIIRSTAEQVLASARPNPKTYDILPPAMFTLGKRSEHFRWTLPGFP